MNIFVISTKIFLSKHSLSTGWRFRPAHQMMHPKDMPHFIPNIGIFFNVADVLRSYLSMVVC